MGSEKVITFFR